MCKVQPCGRCRSKGTNNCIEECRAIDKGYAGGFCEHPDSTDSSKCCKCLTKAEQSFEVLGDGDCCVVSTQTDLAINGPNPLDCYNCPNYSQPDVSCPLTGGGGQRRCVPAPICPSNKNSKTYTTCSMQPGCCASAVLSLGGQVNESCGPPAAGWDTFSGTCDASPLYTKAISSCSKDTRHCIGEPSTTDGKLECNTSTNICSSGKAVFTGNSNICGGGDGNYWFCSQNNTNT